MRKLVRAILITVSIYLVFVSIMIVYINVTDDGIQTCNVQITVTNESQNIIKNLHIWSSYSPKFKEFSEIGILESEFMDVDLPVLGDSAAGLTYTDEFGRDHNATIVGYLVLGHKVDVTVISANKDGLVIEVESK